MTIKLDKKNILLISSFESLTNARVKDIYEEEDNRENIGNGRKRLVFVVEKGDVGKAVGKGGNNIKILSNKFKKDIKIIEYSKDKLEFITNLIYPVKPKNIFEEVAGIVVIEVQNPKSKGLLIGRNASNLRSLEKTVMRHFPIDEIKVR